MSSRVVFWQNIPSIHQAPLLREFAKQWNAEVVVVAESDMPRDRLAQGWSRPDFSPAKLVLSPSRAERQKLIQSGKPDDVHVFSGFHAYPETYRTFKKISRGVGTVGVFAEPRRQNRGLKSVIRKSRYRLHAWRWDKKVDFLLTTGELGELYYASCGFSRDRIVPFGYFVERATAPAVRGDILDAIGVCSQRLRLLFVGNLSHHKGLDLLLRALGKVDSSSWQLYVLGEGGQHNELTTLATSLGIDDRVQWLGVRPNPIARAYMAQADILVLPSRHDGWGAVVNEALMAGTRVVVSDACGASDLVRDPFRGWVFESGSVSSLLGVLRRVLDGGPTSASVRARVKAWASQCIAAEPAARYLIQVIERIRCGDEVPVAPWRCAAESSRDHVLD